MKKTLLALALVAAAFSAHAESPIGGGKLNMSLDSSPCFSWTGNASGASWTRCPVQAPVEKIVYVDKPVEKIVYRDRVVEKLVPTVVEKPIAE